MSGFLKFRLGIFSLAIAVMVALIVWAAQGAWRRSNELRERLTEVQLKSFQIAGHFQQTVLELNNAVLRYGIYHSAQDWEHFNRVSKRLDAWIDEQRPALSTQEEREVLDLINTNYDYYVAAAGQIHSRVSAENSTTLPLAEFANFESQSQRILQLGFDLAGAHGRSMEAFLTDSKKSLTFLQELLIGSLGLLLLAGGGLAFVVYGGLLAPLRVKLVESQALVERQEKLASLGMLAAGVAHEIRNPLTSIKAWLYIQQKQMPPGSQEQADAAVIAGEVNRLERIVKDFLLFARPSEPNFEVLPAERPLQQVQTLLEPNLEKANIRLAYEPSAPAFIRADLQQLQQVLLNLVQNAADSIERDGTITLRVRPGQRRGTDGAQETVVLEVSDTGKGIRPEIEKRLFDPFFTTKETGTGLGLSIAARIVEKHGGALQYRTQLNQGTTFGIVLPRVAPTS